MTRFIDEEELNGRTVLRCQYDNVLFPNSVIIWFTDGSYTQIAWSEGYYQGDGVIAFRPLLDEELKKIEERLKK